MFSKYTSFGKILHRLQAKHGLSNVKLAALLGCYPQNIPRLKRSSNPQMKTLRALAKVFDVEVDIFFN